MAMRRLRKALRGLRLDAEASGRRKVANSTEMSRSFSTPRSVASPRARSNQPGCPACSTVHFSKTGRRRFAVVRREGRGPGWRRDSLPRLEELLQGEEPSLEELVAQSSDQKGDGNTQRCIGGEGAGAAPQDCLQPLRNAQLVHVPGEKAVVDVKPITVLTQR